MKYNIIIPFRNRNEHLQEFIRRFTSYLEGKDIDVQFFVMNQMNPGLFNRGAMLNCGFIEACRTRPDGLFVFHDVDIYPTEWGSISYDTPPGHIRHPIAMEGNLGLICCFWKPEFERVNGFPAYHGWGIEDCTILHRAIRCAIPIDRKNQVQPHQKDRCILHDHARPATQSETCRINTELHHREMETGVAENGLTRMTHQRYGQVELAPRFTMYHVEFQDV